MGRRTTLREVLGVMKDKVSLSKAALLSKPNTSSLNQAILRATTHHPSTPPPEKHVTFLLSLGGDSSRNIAATCIEVLMDRLHKTHNSTVAFKCLITVHCIIQRGSFILQDQLSIYPSTGGRNYLNRSNFRDNSTALSWNLSLWVRWYARVLESLLYTCRVLGFFFCHTTHLQRDDQAVSSLLSTDLVKEIDVLVSLIQEICSSPDLTCGNRDKMIYEAMTLVQRDYICAQQELFIRINEVKLRTTTTTVTDYTFADSAELICIFRRFENCREKLATIFLNKKGAIGDCLWNLILEMKRNIEEDMKKMEDRRQMRICASESARFTDRMIRSTNSVLFTSCRFKLDCLPLTVLSSDHDENASFY